jgi:hypothetical protein
MMPRKSPGHDSRMITYRTLPGSSTAYQRVNVGEWTAWVQTDLEFDLEVQHLQFERRNLGRTYVAVQGEDRRVPGYYTLASGAVEAGTMSRPDRPRVLI